MQLFQGNFGSIRNEAAGKTGQQPSPAIASSQWYPPVSIGIKEVDDGIWLASFMRYDLR